MCSLAWHVLSKSANYPEVANRIMNFFKLGFYSAAVVFGGCYAKPKSKSLYAFHVISDARLAFSLGS